MKRHLTTCVVAFLLASSPTLAAAQETEARLSHIESLMGRAEYRRAYRMLEGVLENGGLQPAEVGRVYLRLGECAAALRRLDVARDSFVRLLAIDPGHALAKGTSPLVRRPFDEARSFWEGKARPSIHFERRRALEPGDVLVIEPEVERGPIPSLVAEITFHLRQPDGTFVTYLGSEGRIDIAPGELEGLEHIEFYLAARDEHGNVTLLSGGPEEPMTIALATDEPELEPEATPAPGEEVRRARPWYRQWWFWTAVGSVVVLTVGLSAGLSSRGGEGPCWDTIDQACDYTVSFEE